LPQSHFFDACGNLVRQNLDRHFAWDGAGRLRLFRAQVAASGSTPEEDRWAEPSVAAMYLYDAAGQRVKKLVRKQGGAVEVTEYVDGVFERQLWGRPGGARGECALVHVMDGQKRIALARFGDRHPDDGGPAVQFHLGDHLGSSALVLDGAGAWVNREEYTPYGETGFGSFARKRFRFTGKERDGESGLSYHGARYYAPWLCRWASCDPAGLADGLNLYAYVRGNPVRLVDRTGLAGDEPPAAGGGAGSPPTAKVNGVHQYGEPIPDRESLGHNVQADHPIAQSKGRLMQTDPAGVNHFDPKTLSVLQETGKGVDGAAPLPHTQATFHDVQSDVAEIKRLREQGIKNFADDIVEPSLASRIRSGFNPKAVGTAIMDQVGSLFKSERLQESGRIAKKWGGEIADFTIDVGGKVGKKALGVVPLLPAAYVLLKPSTASADERATELLMAGAGELPAPGLDIVIEANVAYMGMLWEKTFKTEADREKSGFFQANPDATPTEYLDAMRDKDAFLQGAY
jgi:RHS repeat-associated protein